jgi:hypothetical protein
MQSGLFTEFARLQLFIYTYRQVTAANAQDRAPDGEVLAQSIAEGRGGRLHILPPVRNEVGLPEPIE